MLIVLYAFTFYFRDWAILALRMKIVAGKRKQTAVISLLPSAFSVMIL